MPMPAQLKKLNDEIHHDLRRELPALPLCCPPGHLDRIVDRVAGHPGRQHADRAEDR